MYSSSVLKIDQGKQAYSSMLKDLYVYHEGGC